MPVLAIAAVVAFVVFLAWVGFSTWSEEREIEQDQAILMLLRERGESYGLDLVAASNGVLGRGTVYLRLARLIERGLVASREERDEERAPWQREGGTLRRLYRLALSYDPCGVSSRLTADGRCHQEH